MEKRCIFHVPNYLDPDRASASQIRPKIMKKAFEGNGYLVDVVWGYGKERKKQIFNIRKNVKNGIKYDFLYSESSTMPTLLTEKNHFPKYPFLDFCFFKFIKKNGIKIGLFYRDMHWKFPAYKKTVKGLKYYLAIFMYRYDLRQYRRLLDKFYLPAVKGYQYLKKEIPFEIVDELPPGCKRISSLNRSIDEEKLTLIYVGGLGGHYQIGKFMEAVSRVPECELILCCRKQEWETEKEKYERYLKGNIHVCHVMDNNLELLYKKAEIGVVCFENNSYMNMAVPYKLFEYLGYGIPVIVSDGLAISEFVAKEKIGWITEYKVDEIVRLLQNLCKNRQFILEKTKGVYIAAERNTWKQRAKKVERDLCPNSTAMV